jgi:xanthine dehydrogenase iron-sulfur cluster and FAD-binding subunit A
MEVCSYYIVDITVITIIDTCRYLGTTSNFTIVGSTGGKYSGTTLHPSVLLASDHLAELQAVELTDEGLRIGAATSIAKLRVVLEEYSRSRPGK